MAKLVEKVSKKHKKRVHILAYSFAGVDARCAISLMGLDRYCQSLTTLCSPHQGMTLVDRALGVDQYGDLNHCEKALLALGMSKRNVTEFTTRNMTAFNQVC